MAREIKQGIPYYSLDTDVFSNRKIRRLLKNFGANGYLVYSYVLTEIYRDKGYFIVWDEDTAFDVSDYLNLKETLVSEVIKYCCNVGLFNKELYTSEGILTSKNIQGFWIPVVKKANRKIKNVEPNFNLLKEESTLNEEVCTPTQEESTPNNEESTQSKVKESKVNNVVVLNSNENFKNSVLSDAGYLETTAMQTKSNIKTIKYYLEIFSKHLIQIGESKQTLKDFKYHFTHWLNKQQLKVIKEPKPKMRYV